VSLTSKSFCTGSLSAVSSASASSALSAKRGASPLFRDQGPPVLGRQQAQRRAPFLEYLARNGALLGRDGAPRFADNALLALALLTAESEPVQKDLLVRLTINLMVDPATSARA
jgi:hypothetical protein